jgi:type IV secretory pathway VirB10-like protein
METTRIVEAVFNGGRTVTTRGLFQYDYGQILTFPDLSVPAAYQVQFCSIGDTETLEVIGDENGVAIPDELLNRGQMITAYVYLHDTETDGETRYTIAIPVATRPEMSDIEPTPEEQRQIDILIAALSDGVTRSETAADGAEQSAAEAAQSASDAAISAQTATGAATTATGAADRAAASEASAAVSATNAATSAGSASSSAADAAQSANRAEQAAATAGWMDMHIDERGHLIYEKTSNTETDFVIENGHLIVEAIA